MSNWRALWKFVLCIGIFLPIGLSSNKDSKAPKQDRAWKHYQNASWGYCINYPSRWIRGDAYEGAGLFFKAGRTKTSPRPSGEIDVSVQEWPNPAHRKISFNLADSVQFHRDSVVKFQRVQQLQAIDTRQITLANSPAIFMKDRYYDPLEHDSWIEEVVYASRANQVYRLELVCRAEQAQRFERVFQQVVDSFSFECPRQR